MLVYLYLFLGNAIGCLTILERTQSSSSNINIAWMMLTKLKWDEDLHLKFDDEDLQWFKDSYLL